MIEDEPEQGAKAADVTGSAGCDCCAARDSPSDPVAGARRDPRHIDPDGIADAIAAFGFRARRATAE